MTRGNRSVVQNEPQVSLFQSFFVLIFRIWDFHVNYYVFLSYFFPNLYTFLWNGEALYDQTLPLRVSLKIKLNISWRTPVDITD